MSDITLFRTRRIRTRGATIHCAMAGNGPPLLMLHGYPQTHSMWHRVAPELARYHTRGLPGPARLWRLVQAERAARP